MSDTYRTIPYWIKRELLRPIEDWWFGGGYSRGNKRAMYARGCDGMIRNEAKCGFSAGGRLSWCDGTVGLKEKRFAKRAASKFYRRAAKRDVVNRLYDVD